eukprot:TRINITY_DN3143_c0_g1_i1.p1 TRINITY_DN3143_c0_g1~~TRINITY_DN3143_c0_g1_i1.p1  ORF type:complete len:517 (+),score=66.91 TRINITY_DN3143_c0_g1_i1:74-1624(+)
MKVFVLAILFVAAVGTCPSGQHPSRRRRRGGGGPPPCVANKCECDNGKPATGQACTHDGAHICKECNKNFQLSGTQCVCPDGYYQKGNKCNINRCECDHGTPATGIDCPGDGNTQCLDGTCETNYEWVNPDCLCPTDGYHETRGQCKENECNCAHGTGAKGPDCDRHDSDWCTACDDGFQLENGKCVCAPGFHEKRGKCVENRCRCSRGTGATGTACENHGSKYCAECDAPFHLLNGKCHRCRPGYHRLNSKDPINEDCELDECECEHGTAAEGTLCPQHGSDWCTACDDGFQLENGKCVCAPGYHEDGGKCVENECECDRGTPATGTACETHGSKYCTACPEPFSLWNGKCHRCLPGKHLEDGECKINECECTHGIGAEGIDCPEHGSKKCISCDDSYHLWNDCCRSCLDLDKTFKNKKITACKKWRLKSKLYHHALTDKTILEEIDQGSFIVDPVSGRQPWLLSAFAIVMGVLMLATGSIIFRRRQQRHVEQTAEEHQSLAMTSPREIEVDEAQ